MHNTAGSRKGSSADDAITPRPLPLRSDLFHKELSPEELLVLLAMLEIGDSTGELLFPSIARIAHYTNLSERTVQRVLHGEARNPARDPKKKKAAKRARRRATADLSLSLFSTPEENSEDSAMNDGAAKNRPRPRASYVGLIGRHILVQIAPANFEKRMPASYRLQMEVIPDKALPERWQRGKLLPADPQQVDKWIRHNPGPWQAIVRDFRDLAESQVGSSRRRTPEESAIIQIAIAREHGMPDRLARLCVEMARSTGRA